MYEVIKNVIASGRYELTDMLKKIDTIWLQGDITDEQKAELVTMAQEGANVSNSIEVMKKLEELDKRAKTLEEKVKTLEEAQGSNDPENSADTDEPAEAPEYEAGKWYYNGDLVTFEGETYKCIAPEGVVCVWSPKDYPAYWEKVTTE